MPPKSTKKAEKSRIAPMIEKRHRKGLVAAAMSHHTARDELAEGTGYVANCFRLQKELHEYVRAFMAKAGDDYDAWWAKMKAGKPALDVRGNQAAVDAVRAFTASVDNDPLDLALNVLDEGTAGYELVVAGRAYIEDGCAPETETDYVEIDTWAHATEANVKALWAEVKTLRAEKQCYAHQYYADHILRWTSDPDAKMIYWPNISVQCHCADCGGKHTTGFQAYQRWGKP